MAPLSLKIILDEGAVTRKVKFDNKMTVIAAHHIVKDKVIVADPTKEYALFLRSADDELSGIWLEPQRTLDYYMLRDGDSLEYICKVRNLRIKLLDGSVKTLQVNEGKSVSELMITICGRLGITNHDEYGLCPEEDDKPEESKELPHTGTKSKTLKRDRDVALEQLSKKLNTDDNVKWLDQHRTLRELGVDSSTTVILKRRLFYSDRNVDARDPVQLNLLYVQTRDAILNGRHLVTEEQASEFAGIQCQIQLGDFQEEKHKPGFIENLKEYLPETYLNSWGIEKKLLKAFRKHQGLTQLEAKNLYIRTARELPTYGVTFFLVKEKQKDKKKLVPRLLGINAEAILRLDENSKEILQQWPLTHVKTYHVGKSETFTLNFGDYSDKEYSCKTQDAYRIRDILEGYIDIIRRRMLAKPSGDAEDSMAICHDNIHSGQINIIQHVSHQPSKLIKETFVGPNRIIAFEQGSTPHQGTQIMTMQQMIQTNKFSNPQTAVKGEVAVQGDMSSDCVRKLKRMNSNSVKIVTLLTDPNDTDVKDTQKIVANMKEDLVVVEMGVKATAQQQTIEESRKMLLNEMQDLVNYVNKLYNTTSPGHVDTSEAKDVAEKIAHLTSEMCSSQDPKSKRRSELLNRSRKSFRAGEKMDDTIRRASFIAAASGALGGVERAKQILTENTQHQLSDADVRQLRSELQDRLGKLNAALALYLTAYSDPNNVDYAAAIDSMNNITTLVPKIATDGQKLSGTQNSTYRQEMLGDLDSLFDGVRRLCSLTGTEDHDKVQEASNNYADVANKLLFTFSQGRNVAKENEIIELAKDAGAKTSLLLMSANELAGLVAGDAAADVDTAGVRSAGAASDLLACVQLTAPAIHEPHCQSALTAAAEGLSSSVHRLSSTWKPLVEDPAKHQLGEQLHQREMDVHKALERLKDAYVNLNADALDEEMTLEERQRLKYMRSLTGAKNNLQNLKYTWDKPAASEEKRDPSWKVVQQLKEKEARQRLADQMALLNAAIAELATATADLENPDYGTAELALNCISELMPQIVKDMEVVSVGQEEATRNAMQQNILALCEAVFDNVHHLEDLGQNAAKYSTASSRLMFLISPSADKATEKREVYLATTAYDNAMELLSHGYRLKWQLSSDAADDLAIKASRTDQAARSLVTVAQIISPTLNEARCSSALASSVDQLRGCASELTATCHHLLKPGSPEYEDMIDSHKRLEDSLQKLLDMCPMEQNDGVIVAPSAQQEKKRLCFIKSMSDARNRLDDAEKRIKEPLACVMMREEDGTALQRHLSDKLAQLNAALVALSAATADREKPDYKTAQRAVDTINELMPQIVQDACVLSGTKGGDEQKTMLEHIQKLCDASKALCDSAADTQGLQDAAAKVAATSGKLVFFLSPAADHGKGQEIIGLSAAAHDRASELVSLAQVVSQTAPEVARTELDEKKNRTAVAAQALLTTAQLTASMITSRHCSNAMVSATEHLRSSTQDLTVACRPYIKPGQQERQMQDTQQQLQNSLEKLLQACHGGQSCPYVESGEQQAKQRLCFVNSLSGAKSCFDNAQSLLKQPVPSTKMPESDALVLQRHLSDRLAQLNAAVAALAAATADRERPDYAAAQRAVEDITALMPQLVQEAKTLSATKDGADQKSILQQLAQVCDASRAVCESAERAQGFDEAAAEFAAASGQLMYTVSPATDHEKEEQIIDLSSLSCVLASELLSHVKALTQQLPPDDASELDSRGVATADAAQDLLSVAQVTASSMSSPHCHKSLESAVERLRGSADELSEAYKPHVKPGAQRQQLDESHKQLLNSLDKLLQACRTIQEHGTSTLSPAQQEKQRIDFIRVVSTASTHLYDAEKHLNEPLVCPLMKQSEAAALQHQLGRRLGQINMSVAELTAATNDYKYPDYPAAERSIITITELMPKVIQESKKLSCTKDDNSKKMIHENLNEIYGASRNICNNADDPKKLNEASLKLADSSSKLVTLVRPEQTADVTTSRKPSVKKKGPAVPQRAGQKPAVPDRNSKTVACAVPSRHSCITQDFLNNLRSEESYDNAARVVAAEAKCLLKKKRDQEKCYYDSFLNTVDNAQSEIKQAHDSLKLLNDAKQIRAPGVDPVEVTNKEQSMEDTLARAAVEVAALVSANYSDKLEYKAAMEPIVALTHSVRSIVEDGSVVSSTLQENSRKAFLIDLIGLCDAASHICDATRNDNLKLNAAAILFGDHSAKLLRVVCADINPDLEKEVITRAKAIGDSASRLALEASNAASANSAGDSGQAGVQNIRALGIQVVDAAGKLVYTAKLVAPTIHHSTCQDALVSSADTLSSNLTTFTNTWTSLASDPHTSKLTEEAKILEKLLENLKTGVKSGRLGSRKEVDGPVMLDTPLRQMTVQIVDNARNMAEFGELQPETKQEYKKYIGRLEEALRALDLANARFQRAPHDKKRRNEMEIAIQDLQVTLLQTRPAQVGQEKNNIIDFRDFLQGLVTEADHLTESADKNQAATGKRVADDIKLVCNKISEDAKKLLNPVHHGGDDSFDDIMEIYEFGEDCDLLVKELNAIIGTVTDQKARTALHAKLLPLVENSNFLRFATNSALSTAKSAAYDVALQDLQDFDNNVIKALVNQLKENKKEQLPHVLSELLSNRAQMSLLSATSKAKAGEPQLLCRALTDFTVNAVADRSCDESEGIVAAIDTVYKEVRGIIETYSMRSANFEVSKEVPVAHEIVQKINKTKPIYENLKVEVLKDEDANKLLVCQRYEVEGTRSQLEEKFQQLSTMLCSMSGSIFLSVMKPESLSRSLHATADAASQLASIARALKDDKKPVQSKKIEDASLEMCLATYSLLKISELLAQNPDHHDTRRKLLNACQYLNETINMLNRAIHPTPSLSRECSSLLRGLQLQRSALQSSHQPVSATTYTHCIEALQSQRDVLNKLNSDQAMSREDFLKSMLYVTTAVGNTTECAAHATYLLAASEKDKEVALEGVVDVAKMHKSIGTIHDTCVSVILYRGDQSQLEEIKKTLEKQVDELLKDLDDSIGKTKDQEVKELLQKYRKELDVTAKAFYSAVDEKQPPHVTTPVVLRVAGAVRRVLGALERPALVPRALAVEPARQELCDQLLQYTITLVSNTQDLIKEVKSSPEQSEMRWSSYEKRREVLAAFDALLKKIKSSGQDANILEADMDDAAQNKSYIQIQTEKAFKWLHKPMAKSDVKANGQVAVKNLIDVGRRMSEDLSGADKEDLRHLVDETEQIFSHCCKKYDQEQYGLLMDRIRELQKAIERMAVTRLVEDFMDTEEPLADLDILADAERDEKSRQFILERKIAELLAQLGRVNRTARYIADTGAGGDKLSTKLTTCSQQTELLAPMLVKAAEQRIQKPDDQVAVDNYRTLLAKYTESLSKVRDLCDQSVDPMDFVQTASETMQKMREDSTKDNDPRKCAYTSSAITRLANRVIHVGLSSSSARDDPELGRALEAAKRQLSAATPAPDTRASKMPDWKDTTAKILHATGEVESVLAGETIFKKQPDTNQPIYNEALNLHVAIRDWSSRDNEIVAVAKRMAVLMAKLSEYMNTDKQREVLTTSKSIVSESHEVARLAKKLAHECTDHRIKTNLLQVCSRIPTISGQLKMLTTVKGSALGHHGTREDQEAMDMLVGNAQSLMISIQDVVKAAASASVKIMSQRGPKIKWVRKTYY